MGRPELPKDIIGYGPGSRKGAPNRTDAAQLGIAPGARCIAYLSAADREIEFWHEHRRDLTTGEKRAIAHDECGVLRRPLEPAFEPKDVREAASKLWVIVSKQDWVRTGSKRGTWRVYFGLRDFRVHLPRRVPPVEATSRTHLDEYGYPPRPTPAEIAEARAEGASTSSKELAVRGHDVAENLEEDDYKVIDMDARRRWAEHKRDQDAEELARKDARRFAAHLRQVVIGMARQGVDPTPLIADLERQVVEAEREEAA